jgi:hypothetical protein
VKEQIGEERRGNRRRKRNMDAGRKKELLAHYDKLKELNKEQPSGGDKGASKRKWA